MISKNEPTPINKHLIYRGALKDFDPELST
jgi:hypothetical protein